MEIVKRYTTEEIKRYRQKKRIEIIDEYARNRVFLSESELQNILNEKVREFETHEKKIIFNGIMYTIRITEKAIQANYRDSEFKKHIIRIKRSTTSFFRDGKGVIYDYVNYNEIFNKIQELNTQKK